MAARHALTACSEPGCPELVQGKGACPEHKQDRRSPSSKETATHHWRTAVRPRVLRRDNHTCRYCGRPATQVDHIKAVSRHGASSLDNLVAACADCNNRKGNREARMQGGGGPPPGLAAAAPTVCSVVYGVGPNGA